MGETALTELPAGHSVRVARLDDAQEICDLLNRECERYAGIPEFALAELIQDMQDENLDLERDSRVVLAPDGRIVGYVEALAEPPFLRSTAWAHTIPDDEGLGIGTWMTHWAVKRLEERVPEAPAGTRVVSIAYTFARNQSAITLLQDQGFAPVRVFHEMRIDVQQAPEFSPLPKGITLRTMRAGEDEERLYRTIDDAFRDHYGYVERPFDQGFARWKHNVLGHPGFTPDLVLLAEDAGEIAGFSVSWPEAIAPDDEGWLFQLGVRRPWRRRGLAHALLTSTFDVFHKRGAKTVGLGVDSEGTTGALRLYERAGMKAVRSQLALERVLRAGAAWQASADEEDEE